MSRTLVLVDRLVEMGRTYRSLGRTQDALHVLTRLAGFRSLPRATMEEVQTSLGELRLEQADFSQARRHLAAASRCRPGTARTHFLLGVAVEEEDDRDPQTALEHYRRSLQLDPEQTECLCRYGTLLVRVGRCEEGLKCLRRAAELNPDDPETVRSLAEGLQTAEMGDEARSVVQAALFRNRRDGRFRRLWDDFRFHAARRAQEAARGESTNADPEPVILPFLRPVGEERPRRRKRFRWDGAVPLPAPHASQPIRSIDQRHVQ